MATWGQWIDDIFQADGFKNQGKPVRRLKTSVQKYGGGVGNLKDACKHYLAALIENGNQYVILAVPTLEILYKE